MASKLNIVLVHGAWGDAAHWKGVIPRLYNKGFNVSAVENPLTSLEDDIERTSRMVAAQDGPTLLVGHSYGGMVISGAGHASNVVGLVYVAAFALDEGETIAGIAAAGAAPSGAASVYPDNDGFLWIARDKFRESFCADLDETEALIMAVTQKPLAARCFTDKAGLPAWKTKPSWYQISENDNMIGAIGEAYMASRINPKKTITLPASHASLASRPAEIAELIEEAAYTVASPVPV